MQWRPLRTVAVTWLAVLLLSGCTSAPEPAVAAPVVGSIQCTVAVDDPEEARNALARAVGGTTVCVVGDLPATDLVLERPGTEGRPIVLLGGGAVVRSVVVAADHVVVRGLVVVDGDGIVLSGAHLAVRGNEVRRAARDGISCEDGCTDVVVEGNTVVGADGSGILVEGERITVRGNAVRGSVRRESGDADGIRFFGTGIRIVANTVTDIKDDGYDGEPPHTDCFQTYDNSRLPTVDAVITGNVCRNVDHQCLIATAEEAANAGRIGRSHGIEFSGNECEVEGSQAVLVRWFPGVVVQGNTFHGPNLFRAAIFLDGSTGGRFSENVVPAAVPPYEIDQDSQPGFTTGRPN